MAVTLKTVDLIQPRGNLDCNLFPDNDLDSKIGGWLSEASRFVEGNDQIKPESQNEAARYWAYYLAYSYIADRFAAMPNSVSVNSGADSVSYGQDRPAYWNARALAAKAMYEGYIVERATMDTRRSVAIPLKVIW